MRRGLIAAAAAAWLAVPAVAAARVERAGSVLPPGQSGFVSAAGLADGSGSPHLYDQTDLFVAFKFKSAAFNQPGDEERPRSGVRIVRGPYGVPTIYGRTLDDAWFGVGYAMAQDRLFQLELFRRATQGRLSEIVGKSYVEDDMIVRRDFYTPAEMNAQYAKLPPDQRARFVSLRDGINAWMDEVRSDPSKMPGEFAAVGATLRDWNVLDSVAIGIYLARTVPSDDGEEVANLQALKDLGPSVFNRLLPLRIKKQVASVPPEEGLFPSQPKRTRRQEKKAFRRSQKFLANVKVPKRSASGSATAAAARSALGQLGRRGSNMWAIRDRDGGASLFNGPQLGFQVPELFWEGEVHGPGINVRGVTAPGVPLIAIGRNAHVAWGFTSGLSDEDDLYVEQLVGKESYRFNGKTEQMSCRNETFTYRPPPSDLLPSTDPLDNVEDPPINDDNSSGSETVRLCRTRHGPVQARGDGVAFARRYAVWGREVETLEGLADVSERAVTVFDVDRAMDKVSWNENLMAADDRGNIGYWHPGLHPIRPRGWDERLPYPGTGEAEWGGFLPPDSRPQVINPKQGYLFNWNNVPSKGWTSGDVPARERMSGPFHRAAWLGRATKRAHEQGGGYGLTATVDRYAGSVAQQRPLAKRRLKAARKGAKGPAKIVLGTILKWNGSYHETDANNTTDPGLSAWEAFKRGALEQKLGKFDEEEIDSIAGGKGSSHRFDISNGEAFALRTLSKRAYRAAAARAHHFLRKEFDTSVPKKWRAERRMYDPGAQGAGSMDPLPFFDRGTWQQVVELGP